MKSFPRHSFKNRTIIIALVLTAFSILAAINDAHALSSKFRKDFIFNRRANRHAAQEFLVKNSKEIMPDEIRSLVSEALAPDKTFEERMYLLDHANAMATMYNVNFGDDLYMQKIEIVQAIELAKQEERVAEIEKKLAYDSLRGSIIMDEHKKQMEADEVSAVVYPHWLHQIFFKCKACHENNFVTKTGANDISHKNFAEGKQCAACHNDEPNAVSFGTESDDNCTRCHITGPEDAGQYTEADMAAINASAEKTGAAWNTANLAENKIPIDHYGNIDWMEMSRKDVVAPLSSHIKDDEGDTVTRDTVIIFEAAKNQTGSVAFSHPLHTDRISCTTCHDKIFQPSLGANEITMEKMGKGEFCGTCHSKISFPIIDCTRCHNLKSADDYPEGALIRGE